MENEKRLIDADKLVETIVNTPSEVAKIHTYNVLTSLAERQNEILDIVENSPTIEAAPVVHGRWKPVKYNAHCSCGKSYGTYHYLCSACNRIAYAQPYGLNYCPNCGAKMDGGVSDG